MKEAKIKKGDLVRHKHWWRSQKKFGLIMNTEYHPNVEGKTWVCIKWFPYVEGSPYHYTSSDYLEVLNVRDKD